MRVSSLGYDLELCTELLRNNNKLGGAWLTFTNFKSLGEAKLLEVRKKVLNILSESLTLSKSTNSLDQSRLATVLLERLDAVEAMLKYYGNRWWTYNCYKLLNFRNFSNFPTYNKV